MTNNCVFWGILAVWGVKETWPWENDRI